MRHSKVMDQIQRSFHYLFDNYGFVVLSETHFESFGNWVVVLVSDKCRIRFLQDRGEVSIAVGPIWSPPSWQAGPWFDLLVVIAFLRQEQNIEEYQSGGIDQQLERLADTLFPYCEQICDLFTEENFPIVRNELEVLTEQHSNQVWAQLVE